MTRKLKRSRDFDIALNIKNNAFIRPPKETQRNWLLNKALSEFSDDLQTLHTQAKRFVPGADETRRHAKGEVLTGEKDTMEDWQIPIMEAMANVATESHGDVLEVGYGRGVSAAYIQDCGVRSHTIIECNDSIVDRFNTWRSQYPERDIQIIHGMWQDVTDQLSQYDAVFFHTYPLDETEQVEYIAKSTTFAEHFFPTAAAHLRDGGIFTYLTNEIDSFSRAHQRLVFQYFRNFTLSKVPLSLPDNVMDAWWADSMVVIKAVK